ncbi:MAG: hypothetical protein ACI9G1_000453 [Pirellulaceae bacterium]|jgi:uncharacterized protein (TIGR02996 family)
MATNPLLQEVLTNPADMDARGVYADWLAESGDPRGSFIALQMQLSQMTGLEVEYAAMFAESARLKAEHQGRWIDQFVDAVFGDELELREQQRFILLDRGEFDNGFLERLWLTPNQIAKYWDKVASYEPVTGIELIVDEDAPVHLEAARNWRKLRLHRDGWFAGPILARILNWPLDNLRQLDCGDCDLGNLGARILANKETVLPRTEWPPVDLNLDQLTALGLRGTNVTDGELRMILGSYEFSSLRVLDIQDCRLSEGATFRALTNLQALQELRLNVEHFPEELVGWDGIGRLTYLSLPATMTTKVLSQLFPTASQTLRGLAGVGPTELLNKPELLTEVSSAFTDMCISAATIVNEQFDKFISADSMKTVRRLHAYACSMNDEAVESLIGNGPQNLVELDLCFNDLTDRSLFALADWKGAKNIVSLNLSANRLFTRDGYQALINSPYLDPVKLSVGPLFDQQRIAAELVERFGDKVTLTWS